MEGGGWLRGSVSEHDAGGVAVPGGGGDASGARFLLRRDGAWLEHRYRDAPDGAYTVLAARERRYRAHWAERIQAERASPAADTASARRPGGPAEPPASPAGTPSAARPPLR